MPVDYKIVETAPDYPDVLVFRDRQDGGQNCVRIMAWGELEGSSDSIGIEDVFFESVKSCKSFISDFSSTSANSWCDNQKIKYE